MPSVTLPHNHLGDAGSVHLFDAQGVAAEEDLVANLGGAPKLAEDDAANGVEVVALKP